MIFRHYREIVDAEAAKAWFSIRPPDGWVPPELKWSIKQRLERLSCRQDKLGFEHHAIVAKLKPDEQEHWLEMTKDHNLSVRRLRKSINFGRLATEEEVQGDPADRGHVTYLALLNRLRRWWSRETEKSPVDDWDDDRREGLKKDFKLILDIYEAL
jgi:hypothetical protein